MSGVVLAAITTWLEQAHLSLRITGRSESTIWERYREKFSKTVRGSGRLWPALT